MSLMGRNAPIMASLHTPSTPLPSSPSPAQLCESTPIPFTTETETSIISFGHIFQLVLGQLPLGQVPLGQLPWGQLPRGQLPHRTITPIGQLPLGQLPPGQLPPRTITPVVQLPRGQLPLLVGQLPLRTTTHK